MNKENKSRCVSGAVVHDFYGCESGCDGYRVVGFDKNGVERYSKFEFASPRLGEDPWVWAESLVHSHLPGVRIIREACRFDRGTFGVDPEDL